MRRTIVALCLLATPAMAWDNPPPAPGPQAHSNAQAKSSAVSGAASSSHATGGQASATGGSVAISGLGGGHGGGRAPDITLPSFGGGGMDCPTVGFGAGGSGLGGGGGFGPSWISSDCNNRKLVPIIRQFYGDDVARAFIEDRMPGVKDAIAAVAKAQPPEAEVVPVIQRKPQYCYGHDWTAAERRHHPECR